MPGPLRNPNSRRGQAEIRKRQRLMAAEVAAKPDATPLPVPASDLPACDPKLPRAVREKYLNLVTNLAAAKVPVKQIDADAITMAARSLAAVEMWETIEFDADQPIEVRTSAARHRAAAGKDLIQWLQLICATPGARARIGLKAAPERKLGPLAQLIAAKQGRRT
jgi:hypothetical protein